MPRQRLITPDCSVLIPAFFPEQLILGGRPFDLSARARPLESAIRQRVVRAIAPDMLLAEFLQVAWARAGPRGGATSITSDEALEQILRFLQLPISPFPAADLAATALDLVSSRSIAPPDSWYVACSIHSGSELWLSHRHGDGLAEKATASGVDVHLLTEARFH